MGRRFKLRNGIILQEWDDIIGGELYTNHFTIVDANGVLHKGETLKNGQKMFLLTYSDNRFPRGGAYGSNYDIVEELTGLSIADFKVGNKYHNTEYNYTGMCIANNGSRVKIDIGKSNGLDYTVIFNPECWEEVTSETEPVKTELKFGDKVLIGNIMDYYFIGFTPEGSLITMADPDESAEYHSVSAYVWGLGMTYKKVEGDK